MKSYIVVKPWRKGQQPGEVFETDKLNPVLLGHVKELIDEPAEDKKIEVATPAKATPKK